MAFALSITLLLALMLLAAWCDCVFLRAIEAWSMSRIPLSKRRPSSSSDCRFINGLAGKMFSCLLGYEIFFVVVL